MGALITKNTFEGGRLFERGRLLEGGPKIESILLNSTTHFDSEDDYRTGCRNVSHYQQQHSPIEDYVHPDDQTQPTFKDNDISKTPKEIC